MFKLAALKPSVELEPHQERAVARIEREPSVLLYHGLGSGKTLASIAAGEQIKGPKEVIVPAALRENYKKELKKFVAGMPKDYRIKSYHRAVTEGVEPAPLTIFDEAHRTGREGTAVSQLPSQATGKTVFLTGTPVRNEPSELVPMLRVLGRDRGAPSGVESFKQRFIGERTVSPGFFRELLGVKPGVETYLKNTHELKRMLKGRVDYHASAGEFPTVRETDVGVEMTPRQTGIYEGLMEANPILAYKVRRNLPPSKVEARNLNAFLSGIRQVSNNPQPFDVTLQGSPVGHSPKMRRMVDDIAEGMKKDPRFKALIYSNYLESGVQPLSDELTQRGVPVGLFTGGLSDSQRQDLIKRYNTNKIKALLVSGAGAEGLDLKGTKMVQLMEPHWNKARLDQVVGRAVRHLSHAHLPPEERNVEVRRYFSRPKPGFLERWGITNPPTGADRYLQDLSIKKQRLIDQLLQVLQESGSEKMAEDFAAGLPDPKRFGRVEEMPSGKALQYVVQRHLAQRAGPHYDVRIGGGPPGAELYSWATKKELPEPGGKIMLYQQPLHKGEYAEFEGTLHSGYGKGSVKTHDKGSVFVTHADPNKIKFVVTHHKYPEYFVMIRRSGKPEAPATERERKTQGGSWLLINTTPRDAAKLLGGDSESVGLHKLKYTSIPAEKVDKLFDPNYLVQEKVDGASALFHLLSDRMEAVSYRVSTTGRPIIHTYRVFGPSGGKLSVKVPPELVGTIMRGELYGEREGKAIPTQELGGILNASVQRSLEKQREGRVNLKAMLFDVVRYGKEPAVDLTPAEREEKLKSILPLLPKGKFHLPETARDPEAAKALWEKITSGQHPRTSEGIIGWPLEAGKKPVKVKTYPESDVWVRGVFPGEGKLKDTAAGGFEYGLSPEGPVVGRVGTGFTEVTRREMFEDPKSWEGRMARIRSQGRFPSGAHRAPAFLSLHEDYPSKMAAYLVRGALRSGHARYRAHPC